MNRNDVIDLLSAVTAYDNRTATRATVSAWLEVADRARWTRAEALEAVHSHFVNSTAWIMPAHVTAGIRAARELPARFDRAALPAAADLPNRERLDSIIAGVERNLGLAVVDRDVLGRRCAHCAVAPGFRCINPATGQRLRLGTAHASRTAPPSAGQLDERTGT